MSAWGVKTKVGIVGCGYWGAKHLRVLSSMPDVTVSAVDGSPDRLAEAAAHYPSARLAAALDEILDDVDALVVATPPSTHAAIAHAGLTAGKDVLVEKPLTTSVVDAEVLVETASRTGRHLMVGHTFEYNAAVWKLKEIVRSGALGRVLYIDTQRLSLGRYQRDVNVIWDLAPHDISIVSYLMDEAPITAAVWAHRHIGNTPDVAHLHLTFPDTGTHAFVNVSWLSPQKVRRVTMVGDRRMAVYDDLSDNERIRIYDIGVDQSMTDGPGGAHAMPVSYRTGDIVSPYIPFVEPLVVQDQHFVECVRSRRPVSTPGKRGLEIVRTLAATDVATLDGVSVRTANSDAAAIDFLVPD